MRLTIGCDPILEFSLITVAQSEKRLQQGVLTLIEAGSPRLRAQSRIKRHDPLDKALAITREQSAKVLRRIADIAEAEVNDAADAPVVIQDIARALSVRQSK